MVDKSLARMLIDRAEHEHHEKFPQSTGTSHTGSTKNRKSACIWERKIGKTGNPLPAARPLDALSEHLEEQWLLVRLVRVPERGVPGAAAEGLVAPHDRVVGAHLAFLVGRLVHRREHP